MPSKSAPATATRERLYAVLDATGLRQTDLAHLLGVGVSTLTDALAGRSDPPLLARLAWLLARHPELADEVEAEFPQ
jgi:transcriptional regulator with XRE-family HTH domain